jgi:lysophospholipase L1-like esterase
MRPAVRAAILGLAVGANAMAGCGGRGVAGHPPGLRQVAGSEVAGSEVAGVPPLPPPPGPGSVLVAALGDSISAGTPQWDPSPDVRRRIDPGMLDRHNQWEYWAQRRNGRLRFRNCGVDGQRTDEMARRLARCADGAEVLVIQGGSDDIAQGRPVASIARNLRAMIRSGKRMGARVVTAEVLPWNSGRPSAARSIRALNRRIHAIARAEDVPVLPWFRALEDPHAPGRMRTALTSDGRHPSVAGHERLGALFRVPPPSPVATPGS